MFRKKYFSRFALPLAIVLVVFPLLLPESLLAQSNRTAISWHARDFDNRVVSLGQSTTALFNPSSHSLNPAVPLPEEGVLYLSSPLLANNFYRRDEDFLDGVSLFNPYAAYAFSGFTFRLMADRSAYSFLSFSGPDLFEVEFVEGFAKPLFCPPSSLEQK
jgi:hypothetical protein